MHIEEYKLLEETLGILKRMGADERFLENHSTFFRHEREYRDHWKTLMASLRGGDREGIRKALEGLGEFMNSLKKQMEVQILEWLYVMPERRGGKEPAK
ncbi:MAG: hypothetical protein ACUVXI_13610 [bacterium]